MKRWIWTSWFLLACATGCGGPSAFLSREADLGFYEVVAIAPFDNLTEDVTAGASVSRVFRTELWARGFWQVATEGDWSNAEREVRQALQLESSQPLSSEAVRQIGEKLGAQGVFFGTVREYSLQRVGQDEFPLVAISFEFVDAPSGSVIWDISLSERGGPKFPFFGFGESHTLAELTAKLCHQAVKDLSK
jgi:TolB-like protein